MKHMRKKKQPLLRKHMTWKKATNLDEKRELIKEKRSNIWDSVFTFQKKRRYIFCRKSFFPTKHKILKRQKKATIEVTSFDETYDMKKSNQFWVNIWGEKGKKK